MRFRSEKNVSPTTLIGSLKRLLYGLLWASALLASRAWSQAGPGQTTSLALGNSLPQPQLITDQQGLPQSFIPAIVQDQQGFIWMATRDGLARYDGRAFKVFQPQASQRPSLAFAGIKKLKTDPSGQLWILSEQDDLDHFDPQNENFTNVSRQSPFQQLLKPFSITSLVADRHNRLWVSLQRKDQLAPEGIACLDIRHRQYRRFRFPALLRPQQEVIHDMVQDQQGTIWVMSLHGLYRLDEQRGVLQSVAPLEKAMSTFNETNINSLYAAPNGELLIGAQRGLFVFNPTRHTLDHYPLLADRDATWYSQFAQDSGGTVYFSYRQHLYRYVSGEAPQPVDHYPTNPGRCLSLLIDRSDVLWFGSDGLGIRKYDLRAHPFVRAPYQQNFLTDLLSGWLHVPPAQLAALPVTNPYLFRYTLDKKGRLWLNGGTSTFLQLDPAGQQTKIISLPGGAFHWETPLATDETGRVWTLVKGRQLWSYEESRRQWTPTSYRLDERQTGRILQLVADEQAFWLATEARGLFRLDRRTNHLRQYTHQAADPTALSSNALLCLSADPADANRLWIGTFGSGVCVFDKRTGTSQRLTTANGLPNNVIYSALADAQGYLWMGTNKGLCRLHRRSFQVRVYTRQDGILADEFNRFHYLQLPGPVRRSDGTAEGQIIMAGLEGFTAFYPNQLGDDRFAPAVELTRLELNNRLVTTDSTSPLGTQPIQAARQITLPYDQNFVTVGFAALQFNRPGANRYRYRLRGINADWVESDRPEAIYTALPPGRYQLVVNASNTSGHWSPSIRQLSIRVLPPWWRTDWAYLLYSLLLVGTGWYSLRQYVNRLRLQQTAHLRQQEAHQLRVMDQMKSRFFANITHEFRTPLTLILAPAQRLKASLEQPQHHRWVNSIERNAYQLLQLINQLMELAKADAQALKVDESRGLLGEFVGQLLQPFAEQAEVDHINWHFQSEVSGEYFFDAGKLERIVTNLVSNALKFTESGGAVRVTLSVGEELILTVSDTGIGLAAHELPHIFDRFYQAEPRQVKPGGLPSSPADDSVSKRPAGTGIGLSLVKELVELQQGRIEVDSQPGSGTVFTVFLPLRPLAGSTPIQKPPTLTMALDPTEKLQGLPTIADYQPAVLLVEDNDELADFIADSLPAQYRISRAANGAEGLEEAFAQVPDLVISDVMMPIMDGYTLCQRLKDDPRTNHIPVILLTAKAAHASRIEGLLRGADDYLTKPFHIDELRLRVHNLLLRQERLRDWVRQSLIQVSETTAVLPPPRPIPGPGLYDTGERTRPIRF